MRVVISGLIRGRVSTRSVIIGCILSVQVNIVAPLSDLWAHCHHEVWLMVHFFGISVQLVRVRLGMVPVTIHQAMSLVKLLVTAASAATTTSVAHRRVVFSSNLTVAVAWTHHSQNLGETLAILGQMIII